MADLRKAAQQALEALESWSGMRSLWCAEDQKALDTLRAALEQPEQEPATNADDWLRSRFGAVRGHAAWRDLIEAFNAGRASVHMHERELLEALRAMTYAFLDTEGSHGTMESDAMDKAYAAIAKAEEKNHG